MDLNTAGYIVAGVILFGLGLMSMLSSSIENRLPVISGLVCAGGAVLLFLGYTSPGAGNLSDIPMAFAEVTAWALGR